MNKAVGIPATPYVDDGTRDHYGTATITVKDDLTGETVTADAIQAKFKGDRYR